MMDGETQPVTERTNPLSSNIDIQTPNDIVSTLEACDEEIFNGWGEFPGLFDDRIQRNLHQIVDISTSILKGDSRSVIIFSGCGTSGRLGFITARTFNGHLRNQGCPEHYINIMAGGDIALFTSQEAVEDDPILGAKLLEQAAEDKSRVLFFGITCGLSAPFVAGQLDHCLQHLDKFTPVLLGFNPANLARNLQIEKWDKTFLEVTRELQIAESNGLGFLLNPVVGPEPITGSSRMKSGTATKLLLESIFVAAHAACFFNSSLSPRDCLLQYRHVWERVYKEKSDIASLLQAAGTSLTDGGHVYYIGSGGMAIMGLIDASECPPTYGATLDDVRGFLEGGYTTLGNQGGDLSALGSHFQISTEDFRNTIVPTLTEKDLVVCICKDEVCLYSSGVMTAPCKKACVIVSTKEPTRRSDTLTSTVTINLRELSLPAGPLDAELQCLVTGLYCELAVKWTLNAASTGAHIMKGKVFENIMIDLKASNVKLFHRASGIIQRYSGLPIEDCREYLLRSLYGMDDVTEEIRGATIAQHIKIGAAKSKVVPTALLAAMLKSNMKEAEGLLQEQPVLRQAILNALSGKPKQ